MISLLSYLRVGFLGVGVLLSPVLMAAGTITLQDAQAQTLGSGTCKFDNITGDANGDFIAHCTSTTVTSATFNVLAGGNSTASVVKGASLPLTVTRSGTNLGVDNDVTLVLPTGAALPVGATGKVSFSAGAASSTPLTFGDVTFSAAGQAIFGLSNTPSGATINKATVTINDTTTGTCTNPTTYTPLGLLPAGSGASFDFTGSLALRFRINPADTAGKTYAFNFENSTAYPLSNVSSTISTCPGDFTAIGMQGSCILADKWRSGPSLSVISGSSCIVKSGVDYYLNVKSPTDGRLAFVLGIGG